MRVEEGMEKEDNAEEKEREEGRGKRVGKEG